MGFALDSTLSESLNNSMIGHLNKSYLQGGRNEMSL